MVAYNSDCDVVNFVAHHGVYYRRMLSPIGRNSLFCCRRFGVQLSAIAHTNKSFVWAHYHSQLSVILQNCVLASRIAVCKIWVSFCFLSISGWYYLCRWLYLYLLMCDVFMVYVIFVLRVRFLSSYNYWSIQKCHYYCLKLDTGYSTVLYSVGSCAPTQRSWTMTDFILYLHLHCRSIKFAPVSVWFPVSRLSLQLFCLPSLMLRSLRLIEVESIIAKQRRRSK